MENPASPDGGAAVAGRDQPGLLVERQLGEQVPLGRRQLHDLVVEAGQRDPAVVIMQVGEQVGQRLQRVGHGAAERAGVQVALGAVHVDLGGDDAAHAGAHRRDIGGPHRGVRDHDDIAGQPFALAPQQVGEVDRARLLLAFDDQLDRDRRRGRLVGGQPGGQAERVEQHLALVVGGAAGQHLAVALDRLERR